MTGHLGDHFRHVIGQFDLGRSAYRMGWVITSDSDLLRWSMVRAGAFVHR